MHFGTDSLENKNGQRRGFGYVENQERPCEECHEPTSFCGTLLRERREMPNAALSPLCTGIHVHIAFWKVTEKIMNCGTRSQGRGEAIFPFIFFTAWLMI